MDLAVLKYQYVDKPVGMPDEWPAEVVELTEGISFPPDGRTGWVQMTIAEYIAHRETYQSAYDTYSASIIDTTPASGENYLVCGYNSTNQLTTESWYRDRTDTGSYSTLVKKSTYSYTGNNLTGKITEYYTLGGEVRFTESESYFTDLAVKKTYTEKTI